ncbi:MAG: CatB-related O-acetyltransferase [Lachnospiraceae bacterium]|nr:CatB-related O-acetyltransferase [Lachnospiraceae bacterium]
MFIRKIKEAGSILYRRICFPFVRMGIESRTGSIMKQGSYINRGSVLEGRNYIGRDVRLSNVRVGYGSIINNGSDISNTVIGKYASIGARVTTELGTHPLDGKHVALHPAFYRKSTAFEFSYAKADTYEDMKYIDPGRKIQVVIGNDVWIGNNVSILEGVEIGDGAVVAAGALVNKDVEPYGIYAGIPAVKIKSRFPEDTVKGLADKRWWDMETKEISALAAAGAFDDVDKFLKN